MSETTQEAAPPTDQPALPSVGERLQQARQSQGLSLGEMARQLKLSVKQVEALERNDYRSFPGALWVRGFLRNYAKALGLNAEDLVAKAGLASEVKGETAAVAPTPAEPARERRRLLMLTLGFVVVGLFVLGLLGQRAGNRSSSTDVAVPASVPAPPVASVAPSTPAPPAPAPEVTPAPPFETSPVFPATPPAAMNEILTPPGAALPAATAPAPAPAATLASPAATTTSPTVTSYAAIATPPAAAVAAPSAVSAPPAAAVTATQAATPSATPAPGPGVVAAPAAAAPEENKPRSIRFTFSQSVDVTVKDANGKVLLASLQAAGTEKTVRGLPPFSVYMGNVNAVKYVYRGHEIDPGAKGRTGAAKLTLK